MLFAASRMPAGESLIDYQLTKANLNILRFSSSSFHARTHDTFLVTKGKVQVWINDESRILHPGDLASVPPVSCALSAFGVPLHESPIRRNTSTLSK